MDAWLKMLFLKNIFYTHSPATASMCSCKAGEMVNNRQGYRNQVMQ
jgi:hypothetical protein